MKQLININDAKCVSGATTCCCAKMDEDANSKLDAYATQPSKAKAMANGIVSILLSSAVAFFPKCPMCWAFYMSLFGLASIESIPFTPWLKPIIVVALAINLWVTYKMCKSQPSWIPFRLTLVGCLLVVVSAFVTNSLSPVYGISLIATGAILRTFPSLIAWNSSMNFSHLYSAASRQA